MAYLIVLTLLFSANGPAPHVFELDTQLGVTDIAVEDVNNDGQGDIFAVCADETAPEPTRHVAVFLGELNGGYPAESSFTLALDAAAGSLFFAEVDGQPPRELIVVDDAGGTVYRFNGNTFAVAAAPRFKSLMPRAVAAPPFLDIVKDLDKDGRDEWLIPVADGYEIRAADGLLARVPCAVHSDVRKGRGLAVSHDFPAVDSFVQLGCDREGLVFLSKTFAEFAAGEDWRQRTRYELPLRPQEQWEAEAQLADVNEDGLPDLILNQTRGTIKVTVVSEVYIASGAGAYPATPTNTFECQGAITNPLVKDIDGDGRQDLLLVSVPFNLKTFMALFLLNNITVHVDTHVFNGVGYANEPTFSQNISLEAPDEKRQIAYTMGDFNGDGRQDVAFGTRGDEIVIHTGGEDRFLSNRPWTRISIPAYGKARTYKLDDGPADDLIIFHPKAENKHHIEVVVFRQ